MFPRSFGGCENMIHFGAFHSPFTSPQNLNFINGKRKHHVWSLLIIFIRLSLGSAFLFYPERSKRKYLRFFGWCCSKIRRNDKWYLKAALHSYKSRVNKTIRRFFCCHCYNKRENFIEEESLSTVSLHCCLSRDLPQFLQPASMEIRQDKYLDVWIGSHDAISTTQLVCSSYFLTIHSSSRSATRNFTLNCLFSLLANRLFWRNIKILFWLVLRLHFQHVRNCFFLSLFAVIFLAAIA